MNLLNNKIITRIIIGKDKLYQYLKRNNPKFITRLNANLLVNSLPIMQIEKLNAIYSCLYSDDKNPFIKNKSDIVNFLEEHLTFRSNRVMEFKFNNKNYIIEATSNNRSRIFDIVWRERHGQPWQKDLEFELRNYLVADDFVDGIFFINSFEKFNKYFKSNGIVYLSESDVIYIYILYRKSIKCIQILQRYTPHNKLICANQILKAICLIERRNANYSVGNELGKCFIDFISYMFITRKKGEINYANFVKFALQEEPFNNAKIKKTHVSIKNSA